MFRRSSLDSSQSLFDPSNAFSGRERELLSTKFELQGVAEDDFSTKQEIGKIHEEIGILKSQLDLADRNSGALHSALVKLKSKIDTCKARASGAVCSQMYYI